MIDVPHYLDRIVSHLQAIAPVGVVLSASFDHLTLTSERASALGVLVNELTSNACKHAFPEGRRGTIAIRGSVGPDGRYEISCHDDGIGGEAKGQGLGVRIMHASAAQLGGTLTLAPGGAGYVGRMVFAAGDACRQSPAAS